jgi:peptide deformylase
MYDARGRGLAAPQVGEMIRVFVMDVSWKDGTPDPMVFLNPEIVARSDDMVTRSEGCLSIPGVLAAVARPAQITVSWMDLEGVRWAQAFDGFAAACIQHEIDHLDGVVTFDRVDPAQRAKLEAEYDG